MFEGSAFTTPTGLKETTGLVTSIYRGVRVEHFSYPTRTILNDAYPYPYPTSAENCYQTRPDRGYTHTRSLPVGLPLLGIMIPVRHSGGPLGLTLTLTLTPGMTDLRNGGPPEWGPVRV